MVQGKGWYVYHTAQVDLHGVACINGHVFAVGDKGTILHQPPGAGSGFVKLQAPTAYPLYTVAFANHSNTGQTYGAVAGNSHKIWETKDLGAQWAEAPQCHSYLFETLYALHLSALDSGFAAGVAASKMGGGTKFYTGGSWVCSTPTVAQAVFYDTFRLGQSGWAVGLTNGKIFRTEDAGYTWSAVTIPFSGALRGVHFAKRNLGVAVGAKGTILRSTDSEGKVFKALSSPTTDDLWDVTFADTQQGWAVGEKGTILHTSDGGQSWTRQKAGSTARLEGVCFTKGATHGWAVGSGGAVLHTKSGGN